MCRERMLTPGAGSRTMATASSVSSMSRSALPVLIGTGYCGVEPCCLISEMLCSCGSCCVATRALAPSQWGRVGEVSL
jgi:hypothetical protein